MRGDQKVRTIGVLHKMNYPAAEKIAGDFIRLSVSSGLKVVTVTSLRQTSAEVFSPENLSKHADLLVCVGGDGTLLSGIRRMKAQIPVLGINVGGRGILAEARPEGMKDALERISSGNYIIEKRLRLKASDGIKDYPPALNEIYVCRTSRTKTPTFRIIVGSGSELVQKMDGLVISSPTGSTGHSYSLGGPVLDCRLNAFVLTPAGSISRVPPIVVPAKKVEITSDEDQDLVVDGQEDFRVSKGRRITISRHEEDALMVRFDGSGLRQLTKLGFG